MGFFGLSKTRNEMTEQDKIVKIVMETGMTVEEARNSWALKNWEEAEVMMDFFNAFKENLLKSLKDE